MVEEGDSEADGAGDEEEGEEEGKRKLPLRIILILALVIIAAIIKVPVVTEETYTISIPVNITMMAVEQRDIEVKDCFTRNYSWSYRWDGWDQEKDNKVSPRFWLKNDQNMSGMFEVQFAFIDDSLYKYENYANREVTTIPFGQAAMISDRILINVNPNEERLVTIPTTRRHSDGIYWTYADVMPPNYNLCIPRLEKRNHTVMINTTQYVSRDATNSSVSWVYWWKRLTQPG
ncbi:MAG: hypothetical protein KJ709_06515 [Nanoarchaeota archaeon]|nr:hypothetical protein [Nanoarchaeota archaeon]